MIKIKTLAVVLAASGTALGLVGMGVGAAFTDSSTVKEALQFGSFGCTISTTTTGATISPNGKAITYLPAAVMSSAAGSSPLAFTVASTGSIPINVHVTQNTPVAPFSSILPNIADVTLNTVVTSNLYAAGLQWPELFPVDLTKHVSVTYTVACTEATTPPAPLAPDYTTPRPQTDPITHLMMYYAVFQCEYAATTGSPFTLTRLTAPAPKINSAPGTWFQLNGQPWANFRGYVLAYNDRQTAPSAASCPAPSMVPPIA
jgi:hypothetical protein